MEKQHKELFPFPGFTRAETEQRPAAGESGSLQAKENKVSKHKELFAQVSQSNEMAKMLVRR